MRKSFFYKCLIFIAVSGAATLSGEPAYENHLPHREALDTEVRFWKNIFARVSLNQFVIHDVDNLRLVYDTITLDTALTARQEDKKLDEARETVQELLLRFHEKRYNVDSLTYWEHRVYQLFLDDPNPDKFLNASKNIRAQRGIRENFLAGVRRMFTYLPHIRKVFAEYGLPRELIYLPHVESSFNPDARSHVGATGMWQFMRRTAQQYMKVNTIKDERLDPLVSTVAAARLLKFNHRLLQDWALAITAYNHGLGSMRKAKETYGDYLTIREKYLRRSFGFASKNFYPEVLAVVEICDSLEHYFPNAEKDPVLEFQEITLPKNLHMPKFIRQFSFEDAQLRRLNPGFHSRVWSGSYNIPAGYTLRIPLETDAPALLAALGAEDDAIGDILLAQRIPRGNTIAIRKLREIYAKRAAVQQTIRGLRAAVASEQSAHFTAPETPAYIEWAMNIAPAVAPEAPETALLAEAAVTPPAGNAEPAVFPQLNGMPLQAAVSLPRRTVQDAPVGDLGPAMLWDLHELPLSGEAAATLAATAPTKTEDPPLVSAPPEQKNEPRLPEVVFGKQLISMGEMRKVLLTRLRPVNGRIIVMPEETVGHFAQWLNIGASRIRQQNGLASNNDLRSGNPLAIDFSAASGEQFLEQRLQFHLQQLEKYFAGATRIELIDYTVQPGDNLWNIARKKYRFPVNLLLYFNELNKLQQLFPGDKIVLPVMYQ